MLRYIRLTGVVLGSAFLTGSAFGFPAIPAAKDTNRVRVLSITAVSDSGLPRPMPLMEIKAPQPREVPGPKSMPTLRIEAPPMAEPPVDPMFAEPMHKGPFDGPSIFVEVDFLRWWYARPTLPPLVTSGSANDAVPGALGQPGTRVLIGGNDPAAESAIGVRGRLGCWLGDTRYGWDAGFFYTSPQNHQDSASSTFFPVLARPFFDTVPNAQSALLLGFPGAFDGDSTVTTRTTFWGVDANATAAIDICGDTVAFAGFRYVELTDRLTISDRFAVGPAGLVFINGFNLLPGATGTITDLVRARNEFYGGQVGLRHRQSFGNCDVILRASVALGITDQRAELNGRTDTTDVDGTVRSVPAGLLVQESNTGEFERGRFSAIPELGVKFAYSVVPGISVHAGYDVLYWTTVVRAANQLDPTIDTRQVPTHPNFIPGFGPGVRPIVPLRESEFWAHGFNFGVRIEY